MERKEERKREWGLSGEIVGRRWRKTRVNFDERIKRMITPPSPDTFSFILLIEYLRGILSLGRSK